MTSPAIRTARVPARLSRRHGIRPALERWLADAEPARHGLPPHAIVLVRRLQAGWAAVASPDPATRYAPFAALLARAARPARGEPPADVVWFADEAELLMCLARDALAGELLLHWWWKLVLRELSPAAVRRHWLQSPQCVPRALARMDAVQARTWVAAWPTQERHLLLSALAQVFPIAGEVVEAVLGEALPTAPVLTQRSSAPSLAREHASQGRAPPAERVCNLVLALARDPMAVSDARACIAFAREPQSTAAVPAQFPTPVPAPTPRPALSRATPADSRRPKAPGPSEPALAVRNDRPATRVLAPPATAAPAAAATLAIAHADALASLRSQANAATTPHPAPQQPAARLATGFGGVLFLLNAALQLGLYGDFTQPRRPGTLRVSPWRFLLACGRLFGGRAFAGDPLAAWLRYRAPRRAAADRVRQPGAWLALRERLLLALDLEAPQQLAAALLRLDAQLDDAGERVDLHFALASLPLAIRIAGLDRDPGWIPAAGCDVRFHFH